MTQFPETRYATCEDGVSIAYQTIGDGPVDLVFELENHGNVEIMWELEALADLFARLSSFSRLILHDRRGTGLSGGSSFPDLETRARDLLSVLDRIRSPRVALFGERTAGAALAVFAATYPDRVSSLVWFEGVATRRWSPEYPWGQTPDEHREEASVVRDGMGSERLARQWLMARAPSFAGDERLEAEIARLDRHFMAPSTAADWINVESETDVTAVLPLLRCPTLLLDHEQSPTGAAQSRHVQSKIAGAELELVSGDVYGLPFGNRAEISDTIRAFVARERGVEAPDTVLGTVLFTDIVGSTQHQASVGDRAWVDVVGSHHAIVRDALARWQGVENDTAGDGFYATFDGPARAVRCALDIASRVRELGIEIRAGVHTGECEIVEGKHAGLAVTIGSRIAAIAGPSEVLVSRTVRDLTAGSGFSFDNRGEHELKGVPERWQLYGVGT
ncbi:MAG: adenylate/guanylate cyclase domain-containing protein [Actinobacteria bacterium]|nr:adenylate/guanylate cyclase domain-containing protein [Actinomycetota bacterium]